MNFPDPAYLDGETSSLWDDINPLGLDFDLDLAFLDVFRIPEPNDILQGRGRAMQMHPGNVWFRELVASRSDEYRRSNRNRKTELSREILRLAASRGSRFLKETTVHGETMWQELTTEEARLKVAYTFRYIIQQMQQN